MLMRKLTFEIVTLCIGAVLAAYFILIGYDMIHTGPAEELTALQQRQYGALGIIFGLFGGAGCLTALCAIGYILRHAKTLAEPERPVSVESL